MTIKCKLQKISTRFREERANEQCRNLPQYCERSFTDTVSQKDEKSPPAGLDDTAIPHIEKSAWKKVQYHNTVDPHVPSPSKIIVSEIFNLYELSNYMKKKRPK